MRIGVTGAGGFLGSALVPALRADGHDVLRFVRRPAAAPDELAWDPDRARLDPREMDRLDAVVHLAGAGIGDRRWSEHYRRTVLDSRVNGTTTIATAIARSADPPRILLSASAIGYYGDTGDEAVDETAGPGRGFLPTVVTRWEQATAPAADAGVRVCLLRTGIVLSTAGGALPRMLLPFRFGVGGPLGSGRQWFSWISLPDQVVAVRFLLGADRVSGPVNLTAPEPVRNRDFARALGRALHRPARLPVPAPALRVALGGFADEGVLASQRVLPRRLEDAGFEFGYPDVDAALRALL